METVSRRQKLRTELVNAAERRIAREGLGSVRARALADEVGCAVGAIYNVFADLDALALAVNSRTLAALEEALVAAQGDVEAPRSADQAVDRMVRMALAYADFAAANTLRWRALFDHRLPPVRDVPDWYREEQRRLFDYLDPALNALQPRATAAYRTLLARSAFSALHGVVMLGLEEKLQVVPLPTLREQVTLIVTAMARGLAET